MSDVVASSVARLFIPQFNGSLIIHSQEFLSISTRQRAILFASTSAPRFRQTINESICTRRHRTDSSL